MTTYSAEVNIYNPEAIADAVEEAGETASTYITEITGGGIQVHPASNTSDYTQIDANGVKLYKGGVQVAEFGASVNFYDGQGSAASNVVAQFGASGVQIGKSGESHMELDYHSLQLVDKEGDTYFQVSDLRDEQGYLTETFDGDGTTTEFRLILNALSVDYVKINGTATSSYSVIGRIITFATAPANNAEIEIRYMPTTAEAKAYTFGRRADDGTIGAYSVAEGSYTTASGLDSHAEGDVTDASGEASHAEGYNTTASGFASHAEGDSSVASASFSHAQNYFTVAASADQTAIGHYNIADSSDTYALIIGNGTADNARSNAFMVDWDGYIYPMAEKMADWVTEQGTSGIWTYRKWHSGIAECWGNLTSSMAITTQSAGYGGYRSAQFTLNLPSGLFAAWPTTTATMASTQGIWVNNVGDTSASSIKFFLSSGVSQSAASRTVCFRCSGRWK